MNSERTTMLHMGNVFIIAGNNTELSNQKQTLLTGVTFGPLSTSLFWKVGQSLNTDIHDFTLQTNLREHFERISSDVLLDSSVGVMPTDHALIKLSKLQQKG